MPTLYLIDGTGGAGKSDFIDYCTQKNPLYNTLVIKHTTKQENKFHKELEDLKYYSVKDYEDYKKSLDKFYEYQFPATSTINYLISKRDIDNALKKYRNVYIVVRSVDVILQIKKDYEQYYNINIKTLFLYCEESLTRKRIEEQLKDKNLPIQEIESVINKRLKSNENCLYQYMDSFNLNVYDYVIINSIDKEYYRRSLNKLLKTNDNFDDLFSPIKAFVIMPFMEGHEWMHFNMVYQAISKGALSNGIVAIRQDSISTPEIINGIKDSIKNNYLFIIDLTLSRPNCYYELGLAEQINTDNIVLLKEKGESLPFDLQGRLCHEYSYHLEDYEHISNIVSFCTKKFINEHIFITASLEEMIEKIKRGIK